MPPSGQFLLPSILRADSGRLLCHSVTAEPLGQPSPSLSARSIVAGLVLDTFPLDRLLRLVQLSFHHSGELKKFCSRRTVVEQSEFPKSGRVPGSS